MIYWTVLFAGPFFGIVQGAAIPALAQVAHLSDRAYGYLQGLASIALLVQVPGALYVSAVGSRERAIFWPGLGRLLWIPAAAVPLVMTPGRWATGLMLALVCAAWVGQHISGLAWQSLMGDLIPRRRRGAYFGGRTRLISASTLVTSLGLALFLPDAGQAHARWIVLGAFAVAAACGGAEVLAYRRIYEPPRASAPIRAKDLLTPFTDRAFLPFMVFTFTIAFANAAAGPFLWRHLMGPVGISTLRTTLILQTSALVGAILTGSLWGYWTDRHGTKAAYVVAIVGSTVAMLAWPLVTPEHWWVGLIVQFGSVCFWTGVDVSNVNRLFAHATKGGPGYLAAFNTFTAVAAFAATAIAGELMSRVEGARWLAEVTAFHARHHLAFTAYSLLIIACVLIRVGGLIYLCKHIARQHPSPTAAGVRAITMQIQSGLMGLIYLPVRGFRARRPAAPPGAPAEGSSR
jgi:hypothetical protein